MISSSFRLSLHFVTMPLHWIAATIIRALQSSSSLSGYNAALSIRFCPSAALLFARMPLMKLRCVHRLSYFPAIMLYLVALVHSLFSSTPGNWLYPPHWSTQRSEYYLAWKKFKRSSAFSTIKNHQTSRFSVRKEIHIMIQFIWTMTLNKLKL